MSDYPAAPPDFDGEIGTSSTQRLASPSIVSWALHVKNEIVAFAQEMGLLPKGNYVSVRARLDSMEGELTALKATVAALVESVPPITGEAIGVGDDWQDVIDANPAGTTYLIAAGIHREQSVTPKAGDRFFGATDGAAVMTGARALTSWTATTGNRWYITGQTQQGERHATDQVTNLRDAYPEDLWVNNVRWAHQTTLAAVNADGEWFFDYDADRIYVYGDPTGKTIETAVSPYAFGGADVVGVTIQNLTIKRYATPTQRGVIYGTNSGFHGWRDLTMRNCIITENHGAGLLLGTGVIEDCEVSYNGQIGLVSDLPAVVVSTGLLTVRRTKIHHNLTLTYNWTFEGGGTKFKYSENMLFEDNDVHDNEGPQAWWDISNHNVVIRNNDVYNGDIVGIFYEISYGTTSITGNTITSITSSQKFAIDIANSGNDGGITISGNTITDCSGGVILREQTDRNDDALGSDPDYELRDVVVSSNTLDTVGVAMGWYVNTSGGSTAIFTSRGISFAANSYTAVTEFWHNQDLQSNPDADQRNFFGGKTTAWWKSNVEPTAVGI